MIKKFNSLPLVIYIVRDYLLLGCTADFVIQQGTFRIFPDLAISKRQRRRIEIWL